MFRPLRPNPNPEVIEDLFKHFGVIKVFSRLGPVLAKHWSPVLSGDLARDKLEGIVRLRHKFAHNSTTLAVGRYEVREGVNFLKALASSLFEILDTHLKGLGV